MKKIILICLFLVACEDNKIVTESIDLTFDTRLSEDTRGYYHMTLDRQRFQTLHRVSASIVDVENFWVEWESNLFWYIGDTTGYIINQRLNAEGKYVSLDTSYIIGMSGQEVPTTNKISYSNSYGEINNMIAPIKTMVGDTMILTARWYSGKKDFYIVLE